MGKRIFWICIFALVLVGGWYAWKQYNANKVDTDGAVRCVQNCDTPEQKARFARENSGDSPDGNSEHKDRSAAQSAADIAAGFPAGTGPVSSNDPSQPPQPNQAYNDQAQPVVVPEGQRSASANFYGPRPFKNNSVTANPMSSMTNNAPENNMNYDNRNVPMAAAPVGLPLRDSQSANNPNDLHFGGTGAYQWYRQGNLTWRVDTATGRSCIVYATMEEWQKQIVYSHGCGRNA